MDSKDEMKAFEPTLGERISGGLQSLFEQMGANRYKARQRAQTIIGGPSSNLPLNMGLADVAASVNAPAALAMAPVYASQGMKDLGEAAAAAGRGDYIGAGVEGLFGALNMMPMVSGVSGAARKLAPLKPLQLPQTPQMPDNIPGRQARRADGLSEPEAEQAREVALSRLKRLLMQ